PQVRQRTARARGLQRGAGERRQVAGGRALDRVPGDARVRRASRAPEARLPRRVAPVTDWALELAENPNTYVPLRPGHDRVVTDRYVLWFGSGSHPAFNVAQRFRFRADELDDVRAEIHDQLRVRGRPACSWEVGSSATPGDLV